MGKILAVSNVDGEDWSFFEVDLTEVFLTMTFRQRLTRKTIIRKERETRLLDEVRKTVTYFIETNQHCLSVMTTNVIFHCDSEAVPNPLKRQNKKRRNTGYSHVIEGISPYPIKPNLPRFKHCITVVWELDRSPKIRRLQTQCSLHSRMSKTKRDLIE